MFLLRVNVLTAAFAAIIICFSGPAVADDDDGGGRGFKMRGFGVPSVLRYAPRVLRAFGTPRRYKKRRQARRAPTSTRQTEREIVALGLEQRDIERLQSKGFTDLGQRQISSVGTTMTRLGIPRNASLGKASKTVESEIPGVSVAPNQRYGPLSRVVYEASGETCGARCEAFELTAWTSATAQCSVGARIGVVDTAADVSHPSIAHARIETKVFRSDDRPPSDTLHGTAVLSLLAGQPNSEVVGVAHGAEILHADAFHGEGTETRTDVFDLVSAIDWLVSEDVHVINLSLSGPDNPILKRAIVTAQNNSIHVIAAAGRPDGANKTGYPARYDGVVAVAAIDGRLRASRLSQRGSHIAFAAPGVGLTVAHGRDESRRVDGTSFAAPFVSAAYAMLQRDGGASADVTRLLARSAQDLGASGRDPSYGWGLVRYSALPAQCAARP
jgi:hypothetical protein